MNSSALLAMTATHAQQADLDRCAEFRWVLDTTSLVNRCPLCASEVSDVPLAAVAPRRIHSLCAAPPKSSGVCHFRK